MSKNLIVVESPTKAKTITKYLGKDFQAMASYGHVRDLIPKQGAVDPDHDFKMNYKVIERNKKHIDAIKKALKQADALYLATDPDREGEAISWHLFEILKESKALVDKAVHRVEFNEFTKDAIQNAVANPRDLSSSLVNAQQARRALDYLVGFNLSPLLWKKISPGLSAGRVQSPALRLIVEREEEIEKFTAREYWTVEADLHKDGQGFVARLTQFEGERVKQFTITSESRANQVQQRLIENTRGELKVAKVEKKQRRRNPSPPFITSTLQQEAARKLRFGTQRTMRVAQQLYEGIEIDGASVGLISYMRTDSVHLAADAVKEIRDYIGRRFGADNVPANPQVYKNTSKNAQEAHEAVRPTSVTRVPDELKHALSDEQMQLYQLIWNRTVASQMIHATLDTVSVDFEAGTGNFLRATGSTITNPGFLAIYIEGRDDNNKSVDDGKMLPLLAPGDLVIVSEIRKEQHFTEPPPRYTEASLVKSLEAYGIGRPSTYASIISTLLQRDYVTLEARRFRPTDMGRVVNSFLSTQFAKYVDYEFTAKLEDQLDSVSRGEHDWIKIMHEFWTPFKSQVEEKEQVPRAEAAQVRQLGTDPKTGKPVSARMGRYGPFVQIGTREDDEKPRFAGLRPGQKMNEITLEDALELFKLPRELGISPSGEKISVNIGRFGPYVRYDNKYVSIKDDDPFTISLERALELVADKKTSDANRVIKTFDSSDFQVLRGRYGPYITNGKKNVRVPNGTEPESLTLEQCTDLLANAPLRSAKTKKKKKKSSRKKSSRKTTAR